MDTLESLEPEVPEKKRKLFNKLLRQCRKYPSQLEAYRSRLREEQSQGYFISGLGVAETMVDKKLANRMKKRGMRWSREGAWCIALLLMLRANGQLHQWLSKRPPLGRESHLELCCRTRLGGTFVFRV